jgi:2-polyprenyl-3-methyl-5-hydroxy-6-metoxy-1,4-benzoquinol methylase
MGAAEVVGIDNDLSKPATEFLIPYFKSKVRMELMNVYDLAPDKFGFFDIVIFPGVLYHLRYPFWGLRAIRSILRPGGQLIIETPIWRGENNNAMLFCPIGEDSPYETSSCTFFNEKGMIDTLTSLGFDTLAVEYLQKPNSGQTLTDKAKQFVDPRSLLGLMKGLKTYVERGISKPKSLHSRPPIKDVTRTVFSCRFVGTDEDSALTQYWERTHDIHTSGL